MTLEVDDPRLTAFALGELPEAERPEIEQALADRPDLAREVDQIRQTAQWLTEQLHAEQARETVAAPALAVVAEAPRPRWRWRRYSWMDCAAAIAIIGVVGALLLPAGQSAREAARRVAARRFIEPAPRFAPPFRREPAAPAVSVPRLAESEPQALPPAATAAESAGSSMTLPSGKYMYDDVQYFGKQARGPGQNQPTGGMGGGIASQQGQGQSPPLGDIAYEGRTVQGQSSLFYRQAQNQGQGQQGQSPPLGMATRSLGRAGQAQPGAPAGMMGMMPAAAAAPAVALGAKADADRAEDRPFVVETQPVDEAVAIQPEEAGLPPADAPALTLADAERDKSVAAKAAARNIRGRKAPAADGEVEAEAAPEPVALQAPPPVVEENPFVPTSRETTSTFAIDVDTASYSIVRRSLLEQNRVPAPGEVRIEEMLNYFPYQDAPPSAESPDPFAIHVEAARCPWNAANRLARIGIMGRPIGAEARKPSNLVFLIDVSGSMDQPNKLPLAQWGMQKLVEQLGENDRVAIVVYAGSSGLVLPSTSAMNKPAILARIEELRAGGSTNGGAGIQLAYDQAAEGFIQNGINRVILATDGDFNVGVTDQDELVRLIESKAKGPRPIFLTVLGFGMDNLKDGALEKLADKGNGHYAYIDGPAEARKVLVEEMGATLDVIAKDVKIQVEFDPDRVREYRLIGYENRVMPNQDFRDDRKDGGEIGAGHHVTALYEYVPVEPPAAPPAGGGPSPSWFKVRLRYKPPQGDVATEIERPVVDRGVDYADASDDFKLASAVAGFGMILRNSPSVGSLTLPGVIELASPTLAHDPSGYRREFVGLVQKARDLQAAGGR